MTVNGKQLPFPTDKDSTDCWQGITRMDTGDCLGIMKGRYETIQNTECFDFMDNLVSDGQLASMRQPARFGAVVRFG